MRTLQASLVVLLSVLLPSLARAEIHVDAANTTGEEDGSPEHPFDTIQEGINAVSAGDFVLVADGTYAGVGNRDLDFNGKAIMVASEHGAATCIIDCEQQGRGVYFHSGETDQSILHGFTIQNGLANDTTPGGRYGGAILCVGSSPVILDNRILNNAAPYGGGLYCSNASPTILSNTIEANQCDYYGGGLYCTGSAPTVCGNRVLRNTALSGSGGGIYAVSSPLVLSGNIISGNRAEAENGGGVDCRGTASATISGNVISGNVANAGGGLNCTTSSPTVSHTVIAGNTALRWGGGGIYCYQASPIVTNTTLSGNESYLGDGGGIFCSASSSVIITNCILWADVGNLGNEILLRTTSSLAVAYSNVQGGQAGALVQPGCTLTWGSGNFDADPLFALSGHWDDNGTPEDWSDDFWVDGDYRLKSQGGRYNPGSSLPPADSAAWVKDGETSPCINAGEPDTTEPYDWAAEPEPNGQRINMGAFGGTDEASKTPITLTVDSSPAGLLVTINRAVLTSPQTWQDKAGDPLDISAPSPQPAGTQGSKHVLSHFEDAEGNPVVPPTQVPYTTGIAEYRYTAVFSLYHQLGVSLAPPEGVAAGCSVARDPAGEGDPWYPAGTEVTLTPQPAAGWSFGYWSGDVPTGQEMDNPLKLVMDGPRTVAARFLQATVCVDDSNTTGQEDGSAEHPFDTIQEGIDAAADGGLVKVAQGTYAGDLTIDGKRVTIAGGYVGGASYPAPGDFSEETRNPDPATNETLLGGPAPPTTVACQGAGAVGSVLAGLRFQGPGPTFRGGLVLRRVLAVR